MASFRLPSGTLLFADPDKWDAGAVNIGWHGNGSDCHMNISAECAEEWVKRIQSAIAAAKDDAESERLDEEVAEQTQRGTG